MRKQKHLTKTKKQKKREENEDKLNKIKIVCIKLKKTKLKSAKTLRNAEKQKKEYFSSDFGDTQKMANTQHNTHENANDADRPQS